MIRDSNIIAGLDIGTTKICVLVGKPNSDGSLDIVGLGSSPSLGAIKRGVIVDIDSVSSSIKMAVEQAELMSGYKIEKVYTGVSGRHIKGLNDEGSCSLKGQIVTQKHIDKAIDMAQSTKLDGLCLLHSIPRYFTLDGQKGINIKDPIGMSGQRLEAKVHIVTGHEPSIDNIKRAIERSGVGLAGTILESLASSEAVLSEDEKDLGVVLIDMGGGTCDITIFFEGGVVHSSVLPIGGNNITQDIAQCLRTPYLAAEELKKNFGYAMSNMVDRNSYIDVPIVGDFNHGQRIQKIPKLLMCEIIESRVKETLELINSDIKRNEHYKFLSGVVLTGGSSMLKGLAEFANIIFDMPVRRSWPNKVGGMRSIVANPIYSTGVGLVLHGLDCKPNCEKRFSIKGDKIYKSITGNVKSWYEDMFS
jgi:cell division protein FtsA